MAKRTNGRPVSLRELDDKLGKFRWEVRFLILAGMIGGQMLPIPEAAQAAVRLFT